MGIISPNYGLETGPKDVLILGPKSGLGSQWQSFPKTQAEFNAWFGVNATEIFDHQLASGNMTGLIASTVLTASATPEYSQATPFPGKVATGYVLNSAQRFSGGNVLDIAAGSFCVIEATIIRSIDSLQRRYSGKFSTAGWRSMISATNFPQLILNDGTDQVTVTCNGSPLIAGEFRITAKGINRTTQKGFVYCGNGDSMEGDSVSIDTITNAGNWLLGGPTADTANANPNHLQLWTAFISGAGAESITLEKIKKFQAGI
jgi:hypothetical protein